MPTCKKCGSVGSPENWRRSERNGRFLPYCLDCYNAVDSRRVEIAEAKARGYASVGNTPEYKRRQREAEAAKQGRSLVEYTPQTERERMAGIVRMQEQEEQVALSVRTQWAREWLKPFKEASDREYLQSDEYHQQARDAYRVRYQADPDRERQRSKEYKHANPERVTRHGDKRIKHAVMQSDGTLERDTVGRLFAAAKTCPYCGVKLTARTKSLDHMIPLSGGGVHGLSNVLICCRPCNLKKHAAPYLDWLGRLEAKQQDQARKLYRKMHGAWPEQKALTLQWQS